MSFQSEKFKCGDRVRINYIDFDEDGSDVVGDAIFIFKEPDGLVLVFMEPTDNDPDGSFFKVPEYSIEELEP